MRIQKFYRGIARHARAEGCNRISAIFRTMYMPTVRARRAANVHWAAI